ncbi:tryptophan synthase subunit alpha [Heyndrickxia oleronia]|uniref:Tryptophan synthase alpha chain n=1 Tax=Heyndrickxia oleronia TaxID=38875 RepID=A0A8E2I6C1_9BACI|nr:tryptophan synthase subunit alpha [Heyndrickxia oleronia]MEC1373090.1 tryptophan synthase subunit alpha [Heyndrickxia oleronia]OJH16368.1 tryptophan synthase subunit alpha [Bacillus obstructivus]OOP67137.1 tryptophan synthase subunit alpha [Heyndrickxia oleronia]QQZ03933.1 tryptophan synthase subunit alpha [Heyndrickxia oleronia]
MGIEKLNQAFQTVLEKGDKAFVPYIMAGDGGIEKLNEQIDFFEESGATALELGIPFSDPVADGPTIQEAGIRSLKAGTTLQAVLAQLKLSKSTRSIPIVIMTYMNPIYVFGIKEFARECEQAGVDGVIIPDLPMEEEEILADSLKDHQIALIRLAALTSSKERVKEIASGTQGFLYAVTVTGITGARASYSENIGSYLKELKEISSAPVLAGFGVSTPEHVVELGQYCDGVVVGSKIIELLQKNDRDSIKKLIDAAKKTSLILKN